MKQRSFQLWLIVGLFLLLMLGCNGVAATQTPLALPSTVNPPPAASASLTPAATVTPSPAATAIASLSPTASLTPLPTATLILPLVNGTPVPQPADSISPDNASAIVEMAVWSGHACSVFSLAFSPDGRTLVSTSCDQTVRLWDLASGSELRTLEHSTVMIGAVFSPDGKTVAAWSNYAIPLVKLYDVTGASEPRTFTHTARLYTAAFSPDGRTLAVAAADGTVRLWDLASGSELPALNGHLGELYGSPLVVISVAFSPDGKTLASADEDGKLRLWDLASGKVLRSLTITDLGEATFSTDGSLLVVTTVRSYNNASDFEYIVSLYDAASGRKLRSFSGNPDKGDSVALSPDGRTLIVGLRDNTIVVYDVASGRELRRLSGHIHGVYAVTFSPDGRFIASGAGDDDRTIRLWGVYP